MKKSSKDFYNWIIICFSSFQTRTREARIQNRNVLKYHQPLFYTFENQFSNKPNTLRQRNGFPPNFVHSLDSTHMMLTSMYLWAHGCTFAGVHDCFWTHACQIPLLNQVCRDQFVNLHSYPILENLSEHFINAYLRGQKTNLTDEELVMAEILFKQIPEKGTLDLQSVKNSIYFFA